MTKAEKFMSDAPCHYKADEACAWAAGYNACLADVPQSPCSHPDWVLMPREATRAMTMAGCDSLPSCEHVFGHAGEMLRNAYRKMVEAIADTRPLRRPLCSKCGLEDGACICAHLPRPDTSGNRKSET